MYFCAGVHIILARIVTFIDFTLHEIKQCIVFFLDTRYIFFYINILNKAFAPKAQNNAYLGGLCTI